MANGRLSSDYLYTYTSKLETLKSMLKYGLRHSLNKEKIPYKNSEQQNFIICFCDILPEQSDYHKSVYGNYGLSFTKLWGIENEITPLRYIHEKSPGATENYVKIKNDFREARSTLQDGNQLDYFLSLLLHSTAREKGLLTKDSIDEEIGNTELNKYLGEIDSDFKAKRKTFGDKNLKALFNEWVIPILHMLEKTVDELEKRDAFLRIYQNDFRQVKDKILYDEREWRSVKFIAEKDKNDNPSLYDDALKNEYLPEEHNLKFTKNDLSSILVESKEEKKDLEGFIKSECKHIEGAEDIVTTFAEHIANEK